MEPALVGGGRCKADNDAEYRAEDRCRHVRVRAWVLQCTDTESGGTCPRDPSATGREDVRSGPIPSTGHGTLYGRPAEKPGTAA